jgi:drug/metabolite transporter (DMT)-like permease
MGPLLCLVSAACFGAMAIFGKLSYDEGVTVGDLLLVRFALAAAALLAVVGATGTLRGLPRRSVLAALGMGAIGYATQSGLFFLALERMDASLLALVLYTYPALVFAAALLIGRERADGRRVAALLVALAGVALVLLGAASGSVDALGAVMALGAAAAYTVYILVGDRVVGDVPPVPLAALVCTGATLTFAVAAAVRGGPEMDFGAAGWGWLGAIALVSTVTAILTFFAGLKRVGPSAAAILSTLEPVVTVGLAAAAFGEALGAVQLLGGALVLGAVVVMQWPARQAGASASAAAGPRAVPAPAAAISATPATSRRASSSSL